LQAVAVATSGHINTIITQSLGTLEWIRLIQISNVDTFNFLLNPLFFDIKKKSKTGFSKSESPIFLILNGLQNFKFPGF